MEDHSSSPDPLHDSPAFQLPERTRQISLTRRSLPPISSPTKQTFELDVGNQISPQKIRVTVEAGNSDTENIFTQCVEGTKAAGTSPRRPRLDRRRERTVTTTVPVKGLSDSENEAQGATTPKRGRGRPRKSAGTPVPAKKSGHTGTTAGRRRRSIGDLVVGDDEDDQNFQIGKGVQVGRGKGRSRSRSIKRTSRKSTQTTTADEDLVVSSTTSNKGRGRGKSLLPDEIYVLEDENGSEEICAHENADPGVNGVLQPINKNENYAPSVYCTIRSTTATEAQDPDIVIARFNPGNETPPKTGWSSPRIIESTRTSSPAFGDYPSPSISLEKIQTKASTATALASSEQYSTLQVEAEYGEEDDGDELGEMPEFDTILESEGFSMISVDSVPSLREHISSPVNEEDKLFSAPKNRTLDSVKDLVAAGDDSFSSIPDDVLQAATPARKARNHNFLSVQNSRIDDSFSSVPPEVLRAATPAKTGISKLHTKQSSRAKGSLSSVASNVLEADTPNRDLLESKFLHPNKSQMYEGSFSAVPSNVLDVATPAPARNAPTMLKPATGPTSTVSDRLIVPALSRPTSSEQNSMKLAITRLPTPEGTPSPNHSSASTEPAQQKIQTKSVLSAPVDPLAGGESFIYSQLRSSPPSIAPRRYTYTAHLRQRHELNPDALQTPSIVFSSPSLPPPIHAARGQPPLAVQTEQIERPGLSPIARAGRALQDIVGPTLSPRPRSHSLGSPFKSPDADRRTSPSVAPSNISPAQKYRDSPLTAPNNTQCLFPNPWNTVRHQDDPFGNNVPTGQQTKTQTPKSTYTLGLPDQPLSNTRLSTIRSGRESLLSDNAMSWQAEEEVTANDAITSLSKSINSSASHQEASSEPSCISSKNGTTNLEQNWAAERDFVCKKIESIGSSQVIHIESGEEADDDGGDFGLLLETLNSSSPAVQQGTECFSEDENSLDLSSMIIPEKQNFKPRIRETGNLDLSALLGSSPNKGQLSILTKSFSADSALPQDLSYTSTSVFQAAENEKEPHQQPFAPIPEKMGFKPRMRDPRKADGSSMFGSSPMKSNVYANNTFDVNSGRSTVVQKPTPNLSSSTSNPVALRISSLNRSNSLYIPQQWTHAQLSESESSHGSSKSLTSEKENENESNDKQTMKWTETMRLSSMKMQPLVSPTKSCLRSPVKTPSNGSASGSNGTNTSPSKNVAFVSSSPIPSSPITQILSSTTWSKDHWALLDSILQVWKPENDGGSEDGSKGRRRNSTRVISRLLGKKVFSQGEEMRLKQWHLEVVDEFRGIVPGWQEKVIAMRVFSLIVGEEQRKRGMAGSI